MKILWTGSEVIDRFVELDLRLESRENPQITVDNWLKPH